MLGVANGFGGIFGGMMQSTAPQNLLKSAAYAICSIADLAIHTARRVTKPLQASRAVGSGMIKGIGFINI